MQDRVLRRNVPLLLYNIGSANTSVSPESRPHLQVVCREFPPTPGICSVKSWTKGTCKIDIHLPNFAMTTHQCSKTAKDLDVLVEVEYEKLVAELAAGQYDIVSATLAEAVRQADKVSHSPRRKTSLPAKSFHQVSAHQRRPPTVDTLTTCFQELQHIWPRNFGNKARGGPGMSLLQPQADPTAFGCST